MAFCYCRGDRCAHHKAGEPCNNKVITSISVIPDLTTGRPIPGSARGLCEPCLEKYEEEQSG